MHPTVGRVVAAARSAGLEISVETFPEGTRTAEDAARAVRRFRTDAMHGADMSR